MNCLCNFFENNECLIWIIIALIVLSSLPWKQLQQDWLVW